MWPSAFTQHLPPRPQDLCFRRGPSTDDCCCICKGSCLKVIAFMFFIFINFIFWFYLFSICSVISGFVGAGGWAYSHPSADGQKCQYERFTGQWQRLAHRLPAAGQSSTSWNHAKEPEFHRGGFSEGRIISCSGHNTLNCTINWHLIVFKFWPGLTLYNFNGIKQFYH